MMKLLTGFLVAGLWGLAAMPAEACHCRSSKCGPTTTCAAAPCGPVYTEQKVTAYRCELKTRQVERMVCKPHYQVIEEPRTWTEWVQVVTPVTCKETFCVPQWKEVPITWQVCEWYTEHHKVRVTKYRSQVVQEKITYPACEAVVTPVKRNVTTYRWVPNEVVENVQVCRMVASCVGSGCGCRTTCSPVWETCQVKRTVMNCIPETREVTVNEISYRTVMKEGTRCHYNCIPYEEDTIVGVTKHRWVQRTGKQKVCEWIPQVRDVTRNVVSCKPVTRTGTFKRTICEWKPEKVMVNEVYTVMVPYETTVKVQCGGYSDCGRRRCGLFGCFGG